MQLSTEAWIWLGSSLVIALLADLLLTRALLRALRPTSAYAFLAARIAKIGTAVAWIAFFSSYWYPSVAGLGQPGWLKPAALTVGIVLLAAAVLTQPRGARGRSARDA